MIFRTVDLPAPFGPTTPIFAPGRKFSDDVVEDDLVAVGLADLLHGVDELRHALDGSSPRSDLDSRPARALAPVAAAVLAAPSGRGPSSSSRVRDAVGQAAVADGSSTAVCAGGVARRARVTAAMHRLQVRADGVRLDLQLRAQLPVRALVLAGARAARARRPDRPCAGDAATLSASRRQHVTVRTSVPRPPTARSHGPAAGRCWRAGTRRSGTPSFAWRGRPWSLATLPTTVTMVSYIGLSSARCGDRTCPASSRGAPAGGPDRDSVDGRRRLGTTTATASARRSCRCADARLGRRHVHEHEERPAAIPGAVLITR